MILVDTSIWIRFLAGREPFARGLDRLLGGDEVLGHDLVYGELLVGERGGRAKFLATYAAMHQAPSVSHAEVVELVRSRKLSGRGIGWIDAHLLASTLVSRARLWTADTALNALSEALGVAHADSS
jgi:predicted nucleic acid-binding protein